MNIFDANQQGFFQSDLNCYYYSPKTPYSMPSLFSQKTLLRLLCLSLSGLMITPLTTHADDNGKALYKQHCAACHSNSGKGGIGLPLSTPSVIESLPDSYIRKTIIQGRPGRIMPAFDQLKENDVTAIIGYMRLWGEQKVSDDTASIKGNPLQGKAVYQKNCVSCHGKNLEGNNLGTGVTFSRERTLPIMPPALNNAGFLDAASDGMLKYSILHGRAGTPMPSFSEMLSEAQVNDVVSFIRAAHKQQTKPPVDEDALSLIYDSPLAFDETVDAVRSTISAYNFRTFPDRYVEQGLTDEFSSNKKQVIIRFCNFNKLYDAIRIEPRIGTILPCKITIFETEEGEVKLVAVNIKRYGSLFNNAQLDKALESISETYEEIIDEVTL